MKKCPFCAEDIQDQAILCRYCGRDVRAPVPPPPLPPAVTAQLRQQRKRRVGAVLVAIGFLASFTGGMGFGFALVWLGLWLALPGSAALRAGVGFVGAMFLMAPASTVRTHEPVRQTSAESPASSHASPVVAIAEASPNDDRFEVLSVDSRMTESNDVWSRFAWTLVLTSHTDDTLDCRATIEFLDRDGSVVDHHNAYKLIVPPNQDQDFGGYALLTAASVPKVQGARARATCRTAHD